MANTTTQNITLTAPDGSEVEVEVTVEWEYLKNPCDKEPRMYQGEDDGFVVVEILAD